MLGLLGLALIGWCAHAVFSPGKPEAFSCYEERDGFGIHKAVAQIDSRGYGSVDYTYYQETYSWDLENSKKWRDDDDFNDRYKKLDNCDRFYRLEAEYSNQELRKKLYDLSVELRRLKHEE